MIDFYLSLLLGGIVDIVDDYIDTTEPLKKYQKLLNYFLQTILIISIIYLVYIDKKFSNLITITFIIGGIVGYLFAPNIIDSYIWITLILITIPNLILNINNYISFLRHINSSYFFKNYIYFLIPLFLIAIIFCLIEDKLVPEETSYKKMIDRLFQLIICIIFIINSKMIVEYFDIDQYVMDNILFLVYGWLGSSIMSNITQIRSLLSNNTIIT